MPDDVSMIIVDDFKMFGGGLILNLAFAFCAPRYLAKLSENWYVEPNDGNGECAIKTI